MEGNEQTFEHQAMQKMIDALDLMKKAGISRENSLTITKLEEAMMWVSKNKGV